MHHAGSKASWFKRGRDHRNRSDRMAVAGWELMNRALRVAVLETVMLVLLGTAVGLLGVSRPINAFDEAAMLVGAERIRAGEVPFRDFYALYPPAQYYVLAGLFG